MSSVRTTTDDEVTGQLQLTRASLNDYVSTPEVGIVLRADVPLSLSLAAALQAARTSPREYRTSIIMSILDNSSYRLFGVQNRTPIQVTIRGYTLTAVPRVENRLNLLALVKTGAMENRRAVLTTIYEMSKGKIPLACCRVTLNFIVPTFDGTNLTVTKHFLDRMMDIQRVNSSVTQEEVWKLVAADLEKFKTIRLISAQMDMLTMNHTSVIMIRGIPYDVALMVNIILGGKKQAYTALMMNIYGSEGSGKSNRILPHLQSSVELSMYNQGPEFRNSYNAWTCSHLTDFNVDVDGFNNLARAGVPSTECAMDARSDISALSSAVETEMRFHGLSDIISGLEPVEEVLMTGSGGYERVVLSGSAPDCRILVNNPEAFKVMKTLAFSSSMYHFYIEYDVFDFLNTDLPPKNGKFKPYKSDPLPNIVMPLSLLRSVVRPPSIKSDNDSLYVTVFACLYPIMTSAFFAVLKHYFIHMGYTNLKTDRFRRIMRHSTDELRRTIPCDFVFEPKESKGTKRVYYFEQKDANLRIFDLPKFTKLCHTILNDRPYILSYEHDFYLLFKDSYGSYSWFNIPLNKSSLVNYKTPTIWMSMSRESSSRTYVGMLAKGKLTAEFINYDNMMEQGTKLG